MNPLPVLERDESRDGNGALEVYSIIHLKSQATYSAALPALGGGSSGSGDCISESLDEEKFV